MGRAMRVVTSVMLGCILLLSFQGEVPAQNATRSIKDAAELSETVTRVFSSKDCTRISENTREGNGALHFAMKFRFRCESSVAEVEGLLSRLTELEGFAVEEVVKYPVVNPKYNQPSVDVRFNVVALTAVEG